MDNELRIDDLGEKVFGKLPYGWEIHVVMDNLSTSVVVIDVNGFGYEFESDETSVSKLVEEAIVFAHQCVKKEEA